MLPGTSHAKAEVIGGIRCAEQEGICIQILRRDFQHRTGLLQRGGDVFGCAPLNDIGLICFRRKECLVCFQLFIVHHAFGLSFAGVFQDFLCAASLKCGEGREHIVGCLPHLTAGQFMGNGLCAGFSFLPVPTVVADVVSCRRITQFPGEVLCQHLGLSYIGKIVRLVGGIIVVQFGRDVSVLLLNLGIELLCGVPNGHQFLLFQRRSAFVRFFHKAVEGFFAVTIFLDNATGKAGHSGVTASFGNNLRATVGTAGQIRIEIVSGKIFAQGHLAGVHFHLWGSCAEEEPGGIQRLGIEVWENGIDQLLHFAVSGSVRHVLDGKQHMELRPGGFSILFTHMEPAVMHRKTDAGKCGLDICRGDPIGRVLGVVIVTVHGQAIGAEEIITVAVAVHILGADIVVADRRSESGLIRYDDLVGIGAVAGRIDIIRTVQREHQSYTSLAPSSRAFVINLSAVIMVSNSQSPPRCSSKPSPPSCPSAFT